MHTATGARLESLQYAMQIFLLISLMSCQCRPCGLELTLSNIGALWCRTVVGALLDLERKAGLEALSHVFMLCSWHDCSNSLVTVAVI